MRKETHTDELEAFCRDRHPRLVGFLSLYCGDVQIAEELAQDALMRAVRDWRKVRRLNSPEAWLNHVALNLARSLFRRRAAQLRASKKLAARPHPSTPPPSEEDLIVRRAVASLPNRHKAALVLRYFVQLSVRETAEVMGCPEGTVKTLTYKAIANLRGLPELESLKEVPDGR